MGGRFTEDPELLKAVGGSGFQEDPELLAAIGGGGTAGGSFEPDPNLQPAPDPSMPVMSDDKPWYTRALETGQDTISGLTHGLTTHNDANLYDLVSRGAGDQVRARNAEAASRSPWAFGIADTVGGFLPGLAGGAALRAGSAMEAVGGAIGQGTVQGALQGFGNSSPDAPPGERALAAVQSANAGGAAAGITAGVMAGGMQAGQAVEPLNGAADTERLLSTGAPAGAVEEMGPAARAARAAQIEQAGMHNAGPFGLAPQGLRGYARAGGAVANAGNARMQGAEDAIAGLPNAPQVPIGDLLAEQRAIAARQGGLADPANAAPAAFRQQLANNLQNDTVRTAGSLPANDAQRFEMLAKGAQPVAYNSNELPWQRALEQRRNLDANTKFGYSGATEGAQNEIRSQVADKLRGGIDAAIGTGSNVPPELAADWRGGRDAFSLGRSVADPAISALNVRGGRQVPMSPQDIPGMFTRMRGNSMLAGTARAGANVMGGIANASSAGMMATNPAAAAAAKWLGSKGVDTGGGAQTQQQQQNNAIEDSTSTGHGNRLGAAAAQLLQQNPQAFGEFLDDFKKADQEGSGAMSALAGRLMIDDPKFRSGPGLQLQQMTR